MPAFRFHRSRRQGAGVVTGPLGRSASQRGRGRGRAHPQRPRSAERAPARHHNPAAVPLDPTVAGSWTPPTPFRPPHTRGPYVAIHMTVLPNGDVIAWPHDYNYFLKYRHAAPYTPDILIWDPTTNQYQHMSLLTDNLFCSGSTFLPDGKLIVLGGHGPAAYPTGGLQTTYGNNHAEIFNYLTDTWQAAQNMEDGRYYSSAITLGTGQVLVVAGYNQEGYNNATIEIYTENQGWRIFPARTQVTIATGIRTSTS